MSNDLYSRQTKAIKKLVNYLNSFEEHEIVDLSKIIRNLSDEYYLGMGGTLTRYLRLLESQKFLIFFDRGIGQVEVEILKKIDTK